jgi:hypothetical protein
MSKRTPLKSGEFGYAYVFLSDPGIVLKIRGSVDRYNWTGQRLELIMKSKGISIAKYSGTRNMVYFPGVDRNRPLYGFDCSFDNSSSQYCTIVLNGVETLNRPNIPSDFDHNVSTLSMLRYMRVPPPVSVRVGWTASDWHTKQPRYTCEMKCVEGDRRTRSTKQSEVDKILESLL